MNQKGFLSIILSLIAVVIILVGLFYVWELYQKAQVIESQIRIEPSPSPKSLILKDTESKTLGIHSLKLSLLYPNDWSDDGNRTISQFTRTNIIIVEKQTGIFYPGYYAVDLFNKLYSLSISEEFTAKKTGSLYEDRMTKIASGKISTGQKYVIFKISFGTKEEKPEEIQAFILPKGNENEVIQLSLTQFNEFGLDIFKKILISAKLNN